MGGAGGRNGGPGAGGTGTNRGNGGGGSGVQLSDIPISNFVLRYAFVILIRENFKPDIDKVIEESGFHQDASVRDPKKRVSIFQTRKRGPTKS